MSYKQHEYLLSWICPKFTNEHLWQQRQNGPHIRWTGSELKKVKAGAVRGNVDLSTATSPEPQGLELT